MKAFSATVAVLLLCQANFIAAAPAMMTRERRQDSSAWGAAVNDASADAGQNNQGASTGMRTGSPRQNTDTMSGAGTSGGFQSSFSGSADSSGSGATTGGIAGSSAIVPGQERQLIPSQASTLTYQQCLTMYPRIAQSASGTNNGAPSSTGASGTGTGASQFSQFSTGTSGRRQAGGSGSSSWSSWSSTGSNNYNPSGSSSGASGSSRGGSSSGSSGSSFNNYNTGSSSGSSSGSSFNNFNTPASSSTGSSGSANNGSGDNILTLCQQLAAAQGSQYVPPPLAVAPKTGMQGTSGSGAGADNGLGDGPLPVMPTSTQTTRPTQTSH